MDKNNVWREIGYTGSDFATNKRIRNFFQNQGKDPNKISKERYNLNKKFLQKIEDSELLDRFEESFNQRVSLLKARGVGKLNVGGKKISLNELNEINHRPYVNRELMKEYFQARYENFYYEN